MSKISPEKLLDIKSRLESSCCALCGGERLEIERTDTRTRSITLSWEKPPFEGFVIVCGDCGNSSYYDFEKDCFSGRISPPKEERF